MGKRGNDNAQLSKEDYDALESRESSGDGLKQGFSRASEEELSKRRIIRPARNPSAPSSGARGFGGGSSSKGGGLFANVILTASSADGPSTKPSFAMPSAHTPATKNPFGGISLTPASKSAPSVTANGGSQSTKIEKLVVEFKKYIAEAPIREDPQLAVKRFMSTYFALKTEEREANDNAPALNKASTSVLGASASMAAIPAPPSSSQFTPAPAPLAFSFGGGASAAPLKPQTGDSKPTFSFGSSSGANTNTSNSPAPASSGFSFAPAPMAAAPVPGTNVKIALTPVGDPSEDADEVEAPDEKTELASADTEWDELLVVMVKAFHHRNEGKHTKFAAGSLKIQQNKKDSMSRRMVMRDGAGKVLVNIGIFSGMKFMKLIPDNQPSGKTPLGRIFFFGMMDESRGPEKFLMMSNRDAIEDLHKKLTELSS